MFVGIDVSKEWVDVAVRPTGEAWRVTRDQVGRRSCPTNDLAPQLVVVEATGGYEVPLVATLRAAGVPVAVDVRDFARSQGILAKTGLDAAVIAKFGEVSDVEAQPLVSEEARAKGSSHVVRSSRCGPPSNCVAQSIDEVIAFLNGQLKDVDDDLGLRLRESPLGAGRRSF